VLANYQMEAREVCLNYALHQPFVDRVLIGVETKKQLVQNISAINEKPPQEMLEKLESIHIVNTSLLNPANWKA
jgi:uncharacterized protein